MNHESSIGKIDVNVEKKTLQDAVVQWIYTKLSGWRDENDYARDASEPRMNSDLSLFLEAQSKVESLMFIFHHENPATGQCREDMGMFKVNNYGNRTQFLAIECKRLPPPGSDREREYVSRTKVENGKIKVSGGIQRFKLGKHGAKLDTVIMIGYIQKEDINYWHQKINKWILELSSAKKKDNCEWRADEILSPFEIDENSRKGRSRSKHPRVSTCIPPIIIIHHLWIIMSQIT